MDKVLATIKDAGRIYSGLDYMLKDEWGYQGRRLAAAVKFDTNPDGDAYSGEAVATIVLPAGVVADGYTLSVDGNTVSFSVVPNNGSVLINGQTLSYHI